MLRKTLVSLAFAISVLSAGQVVAAEKLLVAFTAIVEHPALDAVREGAIEELGRLGFKDGENLNVEFESAQGQMTNAAQIATSFVGKNPAVIVAISTPSAQAALAATRDIPIVFSAVTDPVAAGLLSDPAKPGGNITGVTDMSPVAHHVELAKQIVPGLKRLGVVYNPGESNSVPLIKALRVAAMDANIQLVEAAANRTADLAAAVETLVGKVDAIYAPTDNVVASGLEALVATAHENGIPTIGGDVTFVDRGVVAASGFNYHDIGILTGQTVAKILNGANPGDIAVAASPKVEIAVNLGAAAKLGLTLPNDVISAAAKKIK